MALTRIRAFDILDSDYKNSCRVTSTVNINLTGSAPNVVDGVSLNLNDRVLVQGQVDGTQNGIYRVTVVGTGGNGTWVRDTDATQAYALSAGVTTYVEEGSTNKNKYFYITTLGNIIIGSTSISFSPLSAALSSAGGSLNSIQFNSSGVAGGATYLYYDNNTGNLLSNSTTTSTSTTTGAIVTPSLGVSGNIYVGNIITTSGIFYPNGSVAGGGVAGGANTMIQFSNGGGFGGSTYLQYNYVSGNLVSNSTSTSTSTTTGAIVIGGSGGLGVGGNAYIGGNLVLTSSSPSYGPGQGALQLAGGFYAAGDSYIAGNLIVANINSVSYTALTSNAALLYLQPNISTYNYEIGFYSHKLDAIEGYNHTGFVRNHLDNSWYLFSNIRTEPGVTVDLGNANIVYDTLKVGNIVALSGNTSTSITTGAIVVSGNAGVGIGGNLNATAIYSNNFYYANGTPIISSVYDLDDISYYTTGLNNQFLLTYNQSSITILSPWQLSVTVNGMLQPAFSYNTDKVWQSFVLSGNKGYTVVNNYYPNGVVSSGPYIKFSDVLPAQSQVYMRTVTGSYSQPTKTYPFSPINIVLGAD